MQETAVTPEQAARLIRFALSELSSENAHHEFEHLCRHLTRRKICPNVIPATGPVSGGGDQGADFESFPTAPDSAPNYSRFQSDDGRWVFACSLEKNIKKKIRHDLASTDKLVPRPTKLFFFHHQPIKVSDRHKLQQLAVEQYNIELNVFDGLALSELLSQTDTVWIAQRFLSLASEFVLARFDQDPAWYKHLLASPEEAPLTSGRFFEIRDAVRETASHPDLHSDTLLLFKQLRRFRGHHNARVRRKAIYEEFVASLRGLGDCTGYESDLRLYFGNISSLTDEAEIEDAAVLISYSLGARACENLFIALDDFVDWHKALVDRVDALLSYTNSASRRCALLFTQAYLSFSRGTLDIHTGGHVAEDVLRKGAAQAIIFWRRLISSAKDAPLFPVERVANITDTLAHILDEVPEYPRLAKELDAALAKRAGIRSRVDRARTRSASFLEAGKKLKALRELHLAHSSAISSHDSVVLCLSLAKLYSRLHLFHAAKYYALASAYGAMRLPDDGLRKLAYSGFAEAAAADYAGGASLSYYLTGFLFIATSHDYSMAGSAERREMEWQRFDFHLFQIAYWATFTSPELQRFLLDELQRFGSKSTYDALYPTMLRSYSGITSVADLSMRSAKENMAPFFSDLGGVRKTKWVQLHLDFCIQWPTVYEIDRFSQAFCAYLQITLAELSKVELSLIPSDVFISVEASKLPHPTMEQLPDNDRVARKLSVPLEALPARSETETAISAVLMCLESLSGYTLTELRARISPILDKRMPEVLNTYASSSALFDQFYARDDYERIYALGSKIHIDVGPSSIQSDSELAGMSGLHPNYNEPEFLGHVQRRYNRILPAVSLTIAALMRSSEFPSVLEGLRAEGWRDWHIILAIANIKANVLYGSDLEHPFRREQEADFARKFTEPETTAGEILPPTEFTLEKMKKALKISQLTTFHQWGFELRHMTPSFSGVNAFLRRFRYWEDDVPHSPIFTVLKSDALD